MIKIKYLKQIINNDRPELIPFNIDSNFSTEVNNLNVLITDKTTGAKIQIDFITNKIQIIE